MTTYPVCNKSGCRSVAKHYGPIGGYGKLCDKHASDKAKKQRKARAARKGQMSMTPDQKKRKKEQDEYCYIKDLTGRLASIYELAREIERMTCMSSHALDMLNTNSARKIMRLCSTTVDKPKRLG